MYFASDNSVGASPRILDAIVGANAGALPSYGGDPLTREVEAAFAEVFERAVGVFPVATGTAANALSLSTLLSPFGLCLCHEEAHIAVEECGATEFFGSGATLLGLPGTGGQVTADALRAALDGLSPSARQRPPEAVSVTQSTENGTVYDLASLRAIGALCRERGLRLHMDGARFANGLVALGCSPAEMTWRAGVDILSFGATKNGALLAEAVLVFDPALAATLPYRRQRAGHTVSKGRLLAAQFRAYLADGHWLDNARHANGMAARLSAGLAALPGIRIAWPTEANEVFAILPKALDEKLRGAGAVYHPWSARNLPPGERVGADETLVRFVCSFATTEDALEALLKAAGAGRRETGRDGG